MTLTDMKAKLASTEAAMEELVKNGKAYTINGSHSVTTPEYEQLESYAESLKERIFRYHGYTGRGRPDFSG